MKPTDTETQIKQTAKRLFFGAGRLNAKLHEIADEAGVNKALLHYYFRNREKLFETVMQEAMADSFLKMFDILSTNDPFEVKVEEAIHHIIDVLSEYPFMESFIISEINKDPLAAGAVSPVHAGKRFTKNFLGEIRSFQKKRGLPNMPPEHFIVNMMALCAYPASTKPIVQNILGLSDRAYKKFLEERKRLVTDIVLVRR